jgi:hypothetical protein
MQSVIVGAFMIVDSFGHYLAQTVHDHGPATGPPEIRGFFMPIVA